MSIVQKTDHVTEALNNLLPIFQGKPILAKVITSYVEQIQDFENALFGVYWGRMLDYAVGVQLDGLGEIVGEPREGRNDDDYRVAIRVRILVNLSEGTPEQIIAILAAATGSVIKIREYYPAAFIAELTTPVAASFNAAVVAVYLNEGKAAGVLAHLVYYPANVFRFDTPGQGYDEGLYGGAE